MKFDVLFACANGHEEMHRYGRGWDRHHLDLMCVTVCGGTFGAHTYAGVRCGHCAEAISSEVAEVPDETPLVPGQIDCESRPAPLPLRP